MAIDPHLSGFSCHLAPGLPRRSPEMAIDPHLSGFSCHLAPGDRSGRPLAPRGIERPFQHSAAGCLLRVGYLHP
jgi:hypothetical protein